MSAARLWALLRRDLVTGPRRHFFLWALIMPLGLTLLFQVVFGTLFEPKPRLGIVDLGHSEIVVAARELEGIELSILHEVELLKRSVADNDLDAGLVLAAGFDQALLDGQRPELEFYIGGESLASNRLILTVTALDLLRLVEGLEPAVSVEAVALGEQGLPLSVRLVPILVFYALVIAGVFTPGSSLVEEKERGTYNALLTTPVQPAELLLSKWLLGLILAAVMAVLTLLMNGALGPRPLDVAAVILVAASLCSMLGVVLGVVSRTSTTLFALIKGLGIVLFAPVAFYIFPEWPQWIARIFPLYWIIEPVWQVSILGAPLSRVANELAVAVAMTVALVPLAAVLQRRARA